MKKLLCLAIVFIIATVSLPSASATLIEEGELTIDLRGIFFPEEDIATFVLSANTKEDAEVIIKVDEEILFNGNIITRDFQGWEMWWTNLLIPKGARKICATTKYGEREVTENISLQPDISAAPVPEPATMFLLGSGLIGIIIKKKKKIPYLPNTPSLP